MKQINVSELIENKIKALETRCFEGFDKSFNNYLLELAIENGAENIDLIEDEYYYWDDIESSTKMTFEGLFNDLEDESDCYQDKQLHSLLSMYRYANKKKCESPFYEQAQKERTTICNDKGLLSIKLNFESEQKKKIIECLYSELNNLFINTSIDEFSNHFSNQNERLLQAITWNGTLLELTNLINGLFGLNVILSRQEKKKYELAVIHFKSKTNRPLKPNVLNASFQKTRATKEIDAIINKIEKLVLTFS